MCFSRDKYESVKSQWSTGGGGAGVGGGVVNATGRRDGYPLKRGEVMLWREEDIQYVSLSNDIRWRKHKWAGGGGGGYSG